MLDFASMIYRIPALLFAISIHEYAHAQCADSMGDPTARYMGRLTFNPMAHWCYFAGGGRLWLGQGRAYQRQQFPQSPRGYFEGILCRSGG